MGGFQGEWVPVLVGGLVRGCVRVRACMRACLRAYVPICVDVSQPLGVYTTVKLAAALSVC